MITKTLEFRNKFSAEKFGEVLSKRNINYTVDYSEETGIWKMFITDSVRILNYVTTIYILVA